MLLKVCRYKSLSFFRGGPNVGRGRFRKNRGSFWEGFGGISYDGLKVFHWLEKERRCGGAE